MQKVGILNLQEVNNFGCVLGAYALLKSIGNFKDFDAELIDYRPAELNKSFFSRIKRILIRNKFYGIRYTVNSYFKNRSTYKMLNSNLQLSEKNSDKRYKRFEAFRNSFLKRSIPYSAITVDNAPEYDIYLVGSDVVWLLDDLYLGNSPAFLKFTDGKNCRRISYAASLGEMPYEFGNRRAVRELYRKGLSNFDMVSVREKVSAKYLSELYHEKIWCCIDPTLLLDSSDYEVIVNNSEGSGINEYIYVYMLDDTGALYDVINRISKETGLPIVRCCDQINGYQNVISEAEGDGPAEFLDRVKNAALVITNSFHAVCFSILYRKNFFAVRRTIQAYKTEELLKRLNLMDRYLDLSADFLSSIDYDSVYEYLNTWRAESQDYLEKALY